MLKTSYLQWFDSTADIPLQAQASNPANVRFDPIAAVNSRAVLGQDNNVWNVADYAVAPRGTKNIIWSSEGYNSLGNNLNTFPNAGISTQAPSPQNQAYNAVAIPALTAAQKTASGSTASATTGNIGTLLGTTPPVLDLSPYRNIVLVVNLISFTGGASPSFQPEFDLLDDAATPLSIAAFKPTAVTTATAWFVNVGPQQMVMQSITSGPVFSVGTGVTPWIGLTGVTIVPVPVDFPPNALFKWTIANSPTATNWTAFIYGKY